MNLNHIFSLIAFAIGALCFVVFITNLKPPLHNSETAVDSIYGRGMQNYLRNGAPRHFGGQPAVDNSPKARLQRIKDECEKTYGVNSSQSVDCFIRLAKRMAAEDRQNELDRIQQRAK